MNDNSPCGCYQGLHVCEETPPYHFGDHVCKCGWGWEN